MWGEELASHPIQKQLIHSIHFNTTPSLGRKISFTHSTVHTTPNECTTTPNEERTSVTSTSKAETEHSHSVMVGMGKSAHSDQSNKMEPGPVRRLPWICSQERIRRYDLRTGYPC